MGLLPDTVSPLRIDVSFALRDGSVIKLPSQDLVQSFTVEQTDVAWSGSMVLYDRDEDRIETLAVVAARDRAVRIRFGWDDPVHFPSYPRYEAAISKFSPKLTSEGIVVTIDFGAGAVVTQALDKKTRSFPAGRRFSDVVAEIAADRGWKTQDADGPTIESDDDPYAEVLSTNDESDVRFIQDVILKRAVNRRGEPYVFYFERDVVHFHTRDFRTRSNRRQIQKVYRFARDNMGEVISFEPEDEGLFAAVLGAVDAKYVGPDSLQGAVDERETGEVASDNSGTLHQHEVVRPPFAVTDTKSRTPVVCRSFDDLWRQARAATNKLQRQAIKATLQVRGTHDVRMLDYIDVQYMTPSGKPFFMGGIFNVVGVSHAVSGSGWITTFQLTRGGNADMGDGAAPVTGKLAELARAENWLPSGFTMLRREVSDE